MVDICTKRRNKEPKDKLVEQMAEKKACWMVLSECLLAEKMAEHWVEKQAEHWVEKQAEHWVEKQAEHWVEQKAEHWVEMKVEHWVEKLVAQLFLDSSSHDCLCQMKTQLQIIHCQKLHSTKDYQQLKHEKSK